MNVDFASFELLVPGTWFRMPTTNYPIVYNKCSRRNFKPETRYSFFPGKGTQTETHFCVFFQIFFLLQFYDRSFD